MSLCFSVRVLVVKEIDVVFMCTALGVFFLDGKSEIIMLPQCYYHRGPV